MEVDYYALGKRIRQKRIKENLTQEKLAEIINKSPKHVCGIENATTKVSLPTLIDIANALQTTVDYMLVDSLKQKEMVYEVEILTMIAGHREEVMKRLITYIQCFFDMHLEK